MSGWHRSLVLLALLLTSASCTPVAAPNLDLAELKGQPIQPVVAKLGAPASEQKIDGGTSYAWTLESRVDMPERKTVMEYSSGRPNPVETTVWVTTKQACTLLLRADTSGLIVAVEPDGPRQACNAFAAKLRGER